MNSVDKISRTFDQLLTNRERTRIVFARWRKVDPAKFKIGIEKLCDRGMLYEAAVQLQNGRGIRPEEVSFEQEIQNLILHKMKTGVASHGENLKVLAELKMEEEFKSYLRREPEACAPEILFAIGLYAQEESRYDKVFWLLVTLSAFEELTLLDYMLCRQSGIQYYAERYKEEIAQILRNIWNSRELDVLVHALYLFKISEQLPEYLGVDRQELIDQAIESGSIGGIQMAFRICSNDNPWDEKAYHTILWKLERTKQSDTVRIMRWYYMFGAYKEGFIEYGELCSFVREMPQINGLKDQTLTMFMTTRVLAQIVEEYPFETYQNFVELMRSAGNDPFQRRAGYSSLQPVTIFRKIKEELKVDNESRLQEICENHYVGQVEEFVWFYLNSHFKYVVKFERVLQYLFEELKELPKGLVRKLKFQCRIQGEQPRRGNEDRKMLKGFVFDCIVSGIYLEVERDTIVEHNQNYQLLLKSYVPKMSLNGGLRYYQLLIPRENGVERIPILRKKSEYDELFTRFDGMIKKRAISQQDLRALRAMKCPPVQGLFVRRFMLNMAQIISDSALDVELVWDFVDALNYIGVNICNMRKYPNHVEYGESLKKEKDIGYCRYKTFLQWDQVQYQGSEKRELEIKKKMADIFLNSYLRFYEGFDRLLVTLQSLTIDNKIIMSTCFSDYTFNGFVMKNGDGDVRANSIRIYSGYFLKCFDEEKERADSMGLKTKVTFQLEDLREKLLIVSNLQELDYDYSRQYLAILRIRDMVSMLKNFQKSRLVSLYPYGQLLEDYCQTHRLETEHLYLPMGAQQFLFSAHRQGSGEIVIDGLLPNERTVISGLEQTQNEEMELILTGYDLHTKELQFELWA